MTHVLGYPNLGLGEFLIVSRRTLFLSSVAFPMCFALAPAMPARAQSLFPAIPGQLLPAVSAVNGSVGAFDGRWPQSDVYGVNGSIAFPLGVSFGLQFDGQAGRSPTEFADGAGEHLFWRDTALGLIGIYHSQSRSRYDAGLTYDADGAKLRTFGLETEFYLNRFTFKGTAGAQSGRYDGATTKISAAYYATDNLRFDLTVNRLPGVEAQESIGIEWAPFGSSAVTLLARTGLGEHQYVRAVAGIQFNFGAPDKSLIRHHREDLIENDLPENLFEAIGDGVCPIGAHQRQGYCDGNI